MVEWSIKQKNKGQEDGNCLFFLSWRKMVGGASLSPYGLVTVGLGVEQGKQQLCGLVQTRNLVV